MEGLTLNSQGVQDFMKNSNFISNNNVRESSCVHSWIFEQIDPSAQTQLSLQKKIVKIYEIIEKKTIVNVEKTKNNQILKAQIDAYEVIITKIENADKRKYQKNDEAVEKSNNQYQNINLLSKDLQLNINQNYKKQSEPNENLFDKEDSYQRYKKSKELKKKQYRLSAENAIQEYPHIRNCSSRNSAIEVSKMQQNKYNSQNRFKTVYQFLECNEQGLDKFTSYHNSEKKMSEETLLSGNGLQINFDKHAKRSSIGNKNSQSRRDCFDGQNLGVYSPRDSVDKSININSPNKSFLKKCLFQHTSTNNLGFRYSNVDINNLWNQTQTSKFKEIQNTVPKGSGKDYIKLLKTNNNNNNNNGKTTTKNKIKKYSNK